MWDVYLLTIVSHDLKCVKRKSNIILDNLFTINVPGTYVSNPGTMVDSMSMSPGNLPKISLQNNNGKNIKSHLISKIFFFYQVQYSWYLMNERQNVRMFDIIYKDSNELL